MMMNRRAFVRNGTLVLAGTAFADHMLAAPGAMPVAQVGLVTDLHHADKDARGTRHYRESLGKLEEAGNEFAKREVDLVVELGDFIDSAASLDDEKRHLREVQKEFSQLPGKKHHVLGNHCVHMLTKAEFLGGIRREKSYYSFDHAGQHFVVLDSCFRSDGVPYQRNNFNWTDPNIPEEQLEWLRADLKATKKPTIVFAHQRLDEANHHSVKNAAAVRGILEESTIVHAVFQGHSHKNEHQIIRGIHYTTLVAMVEGSGVENNGYSVLSIYPGANLTLSGFRKQATRDWR